ncbi:MAG: hypothetical protein A4E58_01721 [Syntrophorhabdus sp. PtaB.Bin006]|nr:MAG: hypothetical protein A4E58_01721 [Syntrophorhabdus sp. PtaB.Bin006]
MGNHTCDIKTSIFALFGLQNQRTGDELMGGFDSHALPPLNNPNQFPRQCKVEDQEPSLILYKIMFLENVMKEQIPQGFTRNYPVARFLRIKIISY